VPGDFAFSVRLNVKHLAVSLHPFGKKMKKRPMLSDLSDGSDGSDLSAPSDRAETPDPARGPFSLRVGLKCPAA
jgi:hypothetical protein